MPYVCRPLLSFGHFLYTRRVLGGPCVNHWSLTALQFHHTPQGGRFKNSQILTVDIKSKIYRLLDAEEVHHVAPPDNDQGDDYDGFNHGFFPPPAFPRPPRYRPLGGGLHPPYPAPSSSGLPYPPYPGSPHHRAMG